MKTFTKFEIAQIKRTAQNVSMLRSKYEKLNAKQVELMEEMDTISKQIELFEAPIVAITGFNSCDLVNKVIEDTGLKDKNGNPIKITKYALKYPDTVVPPFTPNTQSLSTPEDTVESYLPSDAQEFVELSDMQSSANL